MILIASLTNAVTQPSDHTEIYWDQFWHKLETGDLRSVIPPYADNPAWQHVSAVRESILSYMKTHPVVEMPGGFWDKIPVRTWAQPPAEQQRITPFSWVRRGVYLGARSIILNASVNVGAWVGDDTLIDTYALVGSCAYVGSRVHISSGVVLGGVLEPLHQHSVVIEEGVFVGAGTHVLDGVHVGRGAVLGAGLTLTGSTRIFHMPTEAFLPKGIIPPYSVVVPGSVPLSASSSVYVMCACIVKEVDDLTAAKLALNEALRG